MPMIDDYATTGTFADKHVRVHVLTPLGVLDRGKQPGVVQEPTEIIAAAARDPGLVERTWALLAESPEGGWGVAGHANIGEDRGEARERRRRLPRSSKAPERNGPRNGTDHRRRDHRF